MKRLTIAALAVTTFIGSIHAQSANEAPTTASQVAVNSMLQSKAGEVLKHQQNIEASIRDNKTDEIEKHAKAALKAAEETKKQAEAKQHSELASQAGVAADTARQLVKVGKDGTYAENHSLIDKLRQQATILQVTAGKDNATTGTQARNAAGGKPLNNMACPVSNMAVDSMGEPVTVVYKGEVVTLCCEGCRDKFMESPDENLEKARESAKAQ